MSAASAPPTGPRPCPICQRPANPRYRPFCSKRCADIDLGRWFGERYRIPAASSDANEDDEGAPEAGLGGGDDPDAS